MKQVKASFVFQYPCLNDSSMVMLPLHFNLHAIPLKRRNKIMHLQHSLILFRLLYYYVKLNYIIVDKIARLVYIIIIFYFT